MRKTHIILCCVILLGLPIDRLTRTRQKAVYVTVAAGSLDRREAIVAFAFPERLRANSYGLDDGSGQVIPLQIDGVLAGSAGVSPARLTKKNTAGETPALPAGVRLASFLLPELKAGSSRKYRVVELKRVAVADSPGTQLDREGNRLAIRAAGRQVIEYQGQPSDLPRPDIKPIFKRGGYIHPVYTPRGRVITDDYPADHLHHHGIWFAWTKTEFEGHHPDFWNMGDGTGTVEFESIDQTWSGPVHAGFKSRHRHIDLNGQARKQALNEEWKVVVYNVANSGKPYFMFDLISTQECAGSTPLILPEYRYGGVGFRGHREWLGAENCFFLSSEGNDRSNGHATRARWCHMGGKVGGDLAGIAILDHPGNFRAPQPMRIHPTEPFFCFAPSQMGQWQITPGKAYVSRYRFIVYDGGPDRAQIDRLWNDFADPPQVTVN